MDSIIYPAEHLLNFKSIIFSLYPSNCSRSTSQRKYKNFHTELRNPAYFGLLNKYVQKQKIVCFSLISDVVGDDAIPELIVKQ